MKNILLIMAAALIGASPLAALASQPIMVSSYEVYVLSEGTGEGNTGILIDAPEEVTAQYAPDGKFPTATNAVLVRKGDRVWLIDTGYGRTIFDQMAALGIEPEDVDEVLLTHMHGDHIGGMLRDGAKAFPKAKISLAQREFDYWSAEKNESALNIFSAYGNAVVNFTPVEIDAPLKNGITPIAAYGHTPGHTMFMINDGGEQLLIWGDLTHAMAIQMPHPEISVRYDSDPAAARESRLKVLRYIAAENIPVVGMHIPATTDGTVTADGKGYKFKTLP